MEDLLAREHIAERHVYDLLTKPDEPISSLLEAFAAYRHVCHETIFADFRNVEHFATRLWKAHCAGKNYFHVALASLRKRHAQQQQQPVETRKLMKLYLEFIKKSQVSYREYVFILSTSSIGVPELEAVAQMRSTMKDKNNGSGESQPLFIAPELHTLILKSAHQTLIYLGDLSRWRASEQLDKTPEFGPAIGYYGLAATLMPSSGMGHHQQAVVELEQRHHLYAIYHLYRALVVEEPHPNAANNLHAEFRKTNSAWEKGELIKKGPPNDPDAPKRALVGWFVRLHSVCYKGENFSGYEELEREVLGQLSNGIKYRTTDEKVDEKTEKLVRKMALINLSAQYWAGEKFKADPNKSQHQQSFFYFFRFNIATFTTLLQYFNEELKARLLSLEGNDVELAVKITPSLRCILPTLRLYNMWLLSMVHMIVGLASEPFLAEAIAQLWPHYARVIDMIAQGFPIWDLEDIPDVTYMLEEDSDTMEFKPLMDDKTRKTWYYKDSGEMKKKFTDVAISKASVDDEMLQRIKDLLTDGLYLANDDDTAPIHLRGTRVFFGDERSLEDLIVKPIEHEPPVIATLPAPVKQAAKPISYAAAAANGRVHRPLAAPVPRKHDVVEEQQARENQLESMVADLVDDDDVNNPVTPPQPIANHPAAISNGDVHFHAHETEQDIGQVSKYGPSIAPYSNGWSHRTNIAHTPPTTRSPRGHNAPHERLQSVANLWDTTPGLSSPYNPGYPVSAVNSPALVGAPGHSRVNSASSVRSKGSQNASESWPSVENSLLFGAGGGTWSTAIARPGTGIRNVSPSNGQGG